MKRIPFLLLTALLSCSMVRAAKADPTPQRITQPDGKTVTVIAFGDEAASYVTTTDGVLLTLENDLFYIAKVTEQGLLESTGLLAHDAEMRSPQEQKLADEQDRECFMQTFTKEWNRARQPKTALAKSYFPHTDNPKALVVLVEFQDTVFHWSNTNEIFDQYLNASTLDPSLADGTLAYNGCSVSEYYRTCSFGKFNPQFDVVGPIKLPQTIIYYAQSKEDRPTELTNDALKVLGNSVDLKQYDLDKDGYVDLLYFICAGYSNTNNLQYPNITFWPKVTTVSCNTSQGVRISRIGISTELYGKVDKPHASQVSGIGLFCHEFGHALGLPDLYATVSTAQMLNQTFEYWDLMDGGEYVRSGYNPAALSALEREWLGWMKIETLSEPATLTMKPIYEGGKAYRIQAEDDNPDHCYILENIQKTGLNEYVLGHGLMVTDCKWTGFGKTLIPNSSYKRENNDDGTSILYSNSLISLVPADGFVAISYQLNNPIWDGDKCVTLSSEDYRLSHEGDPYPGPNNVTEILTECKDIYCILPEKTYHFCTKDGYLGKPVTDICEEDGIVYCKFDGGNSILAPTAVEAPSLFNLAGQRVQQSYKGIVIQGNKKILKR